jgi:hypothetical protein
MGRKYILIGIVLFVSPLFWLGDHLKRFNVEGKGEFVTMEIVDKSSSCYGEKLNGNGCKTNKD